MYLCSIKDSTIKQQAAFSKLSLNSFFLQQCQYNCGGPKPILLIELCKSVFQHPCAHSYSLLSISDPLWKRGALIQLLLTSFLTRFLNEFSWEFFLVFLEGLDWFRCTSTGVLEALCDTARNQGLYRYLSICLDFSTSTQQADAAEQAGLCIVHLQGQQLVGEGKHQVCERAEASVVHLGPVQGQPV